MIAAPSTGGSIRPRSIRPRCNTRTCAMAGSSSGSRCASGHCPRGPTTATTATAPSVSHFADILWVNYCTTRPFRSAISLATPLMIASSPPSPSTRQMPVLRSTTTFPVGDPEPTGPCSSGLGHSLVARTPPKASRMMQYQTRFPYRGPYIIRGSALMTNPPLILPPSCRNDRVRKPHRDTRNEHGGADPDGELATAQMTSGTAVAQDVRCNCHENMYPGTGFAYRSFLTI
jgi:hypothetical protein